MLGDWFRELRLPLRGFLARRRMGTAADIDDIAQEVFLRLLRYDSAEPVSHPQAYLFKIAANVSAKWATHSRHRLPHHSDWLSELVDTMSPESELERAGIDEQLAKALQTLPARAREILRLHHSEGMTNPEIASKLGLTRKIVKRDTARAYAALRIALDRDLVATSTPASVAELP
jgi:RNA polymerase sigma-70 factor (ECF subfamily)